MSVKCKNCGGGLDVRLAVNGVIGCKYFHTQWKAPMEEIPYVQKEDIEKLL